MRTTTIVQLVSALLLLFALPARALAQSDHVFHVKVDFTAHHGSGNQTAWLYDENYIQFEDSDRRDNTSMIDLDEWLGRQPNQTSWFLGIVEIKVILRDDQTEEEWDVTDDARFTEMNHHFVTEFYGGPHAVADPCNLKRPVGAGSELTPFLFDGNYGFSANEEFLHGWQWHWANPADVSIPANASVYMRFTLRFHLAGSGAYNNTNVVWLHANDGAACDPHLCVGSGGSTVTGPDYTAATAGRIVLAMPHVHDHATAIRLMRRVSGNPTTVKSFDVFNDIEYDAEHACDHENEVAWHNHDGTQDTGHLPVGGHEAWAPGSGGPTFSSGDKFYCEAAFNNPHEEDIDNMAIVVIFTAAN